MSAPKTISDISQELHALANPADAKHLQRFFKTNEGQYGAGDKMLGIRVPQIRALAKKHRGTSLDDSLLLLRSPVCWRFRFLCEEQAGRASSGL